MATCCFFYHKIYQKGVLPVSATPKRKRYIINSDKTYMINCYDHSNPTIRTVNKVVLMIDLIYVRFTASFYIEPPTEKENE